MNHNTPVTKEVITMSKQRSRMHRVATGLAVPAGILTLALAAACDRESDPVGTEGEPPPEMEKPAETDDPAAAAAGAGDDPYAQAEPPPGAGDPAGQPPPAGEAPPGAPGGQPGMGGAAAHGGEPVSDEDLESFADAYLEVEDLQQELEAEFRAAESNEEAQEIQQRAISELRETVEESGMDFQTYEMIAQRLQQDPELIQRVEQTIESRRD